MDKYYATHFISALSALLSLFIIYKIVFVNLKAPKIFSILPLVIAPLGVVQVARYSTPDALAFLISTAIFSLFLAKRHFWVLTMLPFLVLVRTDLIILCLSLALYYFAFDRKLFKPYVASFATCLLIYFSVNVYFGNYGWQTIFYVTLIERIANPAELTLSVSLHQYFVALEKGIYKAFESTSFVVYALSTLSILIYHIKYKFFYAVLSSPNSYLLESIHYINLAFFTLHFILFPVAWDRFFVTQYVFTLLLFLMLVYKFSKSKDADSLIAAGF